MYSEKAFDQIDIYISKSDYFDGSNPSANTCEFSD